MLSEPYVPSHYRCLAVHEYKASQNFYMSQANYNPICVEHQQLGQCLSWHQNGILLILKIKLKIILKLFYKFINLSALNREG